MWQPPWGCYSIPGCPPNSNLGDFLGQPQGALQLMSNLWDTIIHKVFLQDNGLLQDKHCGKLQARLCLRETLQEVIPLWSLLQQHLKVLLLCPACKSTSTCSTYVTSFCGKCTSRKLSWPTWYGDTSKPYISWTMSSTL